MVKRTARKRKAEDSSSAFFTTTNVTPQISEQNINDKSAFFRASIRFSIHTIRHASVSAIATRCIPLRSKHAHAKRLTHRGSQVESLHAHQAPRKICDSSEPVPR